MTRPVAVLAVIGLGLLLVAALTALQFAGVPGWLVLAAQIGIGATAVVTGLLVNRITRRRDDR